MVEDVRKGFCGGGDGREVEDLRHIDPIHGGSQLARRKGRFFLKW